jgi:hypothetical protein
VDGEAKKQATLGTALACTRLLLALGELAAALVVHAEGRHQRVHHQQLQRAEKRGKKE